MRQKWTEDTTGQKWTKPNESGHNRIKEDNAKTQCNNGAYPLPRCPCYSSCEGVKSC